TWTSDNTDAICRLNIQYGTSFIYPAITMGAHVSAVPNHQVGRITSLATRGAIAMAGNLGYELDLTQLPQTELTEIAQQVQTYKAIRPIIQAGDLYRLLNPTTTPNETAFLYISKDKTEAVVTYCKVLAQAESPTTVLRLKGLDETARYRDTKTQQCYGGDELMHVGVTIPLARTDFYTVTFHFQKC
ncbi:MAG: alpha-galactosidase, partial [Culicoidibacterales bacterium]